MSQNLLKMFFFLDVNYDGIFFFLDLGDEIRYCLQRFDYYVLFEGVSYGIDLEFVLVLVFLRIVLFVGYRLLFQNGR